MGTPTEQSRQVFNETKTKTKTMAMAKTKTCSLPVGELIGEIRSSQNRSGTRQEDSQLGVRTTQMG